MNCREICACSLGVYAIITTVGGMILFFRNSCESLIYLLSPDSRERADALCFKAAAAPPTAV